jgi:hypothetical protein
MSHPYAAGQKSPTSRENGIGQLEESIAAFDARIEAALAPFRDIVERLKEVPGLGPDRR